MGFIKEHGKVTVVELTELFSLSEGRVRAILLEMVKAGAIKKNGRTKSVYYTLE